MPPRRVIRTGLRGRPGTGYTKFSKNKSRHHVRPAITQLSTSRIGTNFRWNSEFIKPKLTCSLRYAETFTLSTGLVGVCGTTQLMRCNSVYDPNQTGIGHQCFQYDQIQNLYAEYRVNKCKVELIWTTIGASADVCCLSMVTPSHGFLTLAGATLDTCAERGGVSTTTLSATGNTRSVKQTINLNLPKVEGITKTKYMSEDNYAALVTSNPALNISIELGVASYSAAAGEACTCQVILTYGVSFYNKITQGPS